MAITGVLLGLLLAGGLLRDGAEAQSRQCSAAGYAGTRPQASFTTAPNPAEAGAPVAFDGSASRGGAGAAVTAWYWDLDGDGGFETVRSTPTISKRYASAGRVTVRLAVVDACRFVSPPASATLDVAPPDAPGLDIATPRRLSFRTAARRGILLRAACDEACRLTATVTADPTTRRALGLRGTRLARRTGALAAAGRRTLRLRLRLSAAQRRRGLRARLRSVRIRVEARDPAGNRTVRRRTVALGR